MIDESIQELITRSVYVVVAYDAWREDNVPRTVCAFLTEEGARGFERQASEYTVQYGNQNNFPFDSPFDPEAKAQCVSRAPWYDVLEVELKG